MAIPVFKPKEGQVDFTNIRWAPVVNCVVVCEGKILLVKRNPDMRLFPGYWNGISGFLDDNKSLEEKVYEEMSEELGYRPEDIVSIELKDIFDQESPEYKKTWIVHAVRVEVRHTDIKTDWEAERHAWIAAEDISSYDLMPGFEGVIDVCLK